MAGVPNVCYKNNTHILGISIHFFPKDVAVGLNGLNGLNGLWRCLLWTHDIRQIGGR